MLVAPNEKVDAVYCPTAVIPVTKIVPFSSACSWVMNAAQVFSGIPASIEAPKRQRSVKSG
jgi:hypothetical protein